jgi:outer membrane receptor protein involved in Fe transport
MVYSRIASGYRPGGPSFNRTLPGAPQSLKADTTENYEVGIKGDVFDHLLSIDASAYYIDWKDIPVLIQPRNSVLTYLDNAGGAISKGLEVSFSLRPLPGLTLSAWGAWSDAYIDKLPANASPGFDVGSRLPFSPRFAGNASIDYEHPLSETMSGNMGIAVSYVGDRAWLIGSPEDVLTSYAQADAYVGLKSGRWTVNAFVNNVTDERGRIGPKVLDGIQGQPPPVSVLVIRPRTMGLSIAKDF